MDSTPNHMTKGDLSAFLEGIRASASTVHSLSTALISTEVAGKFTCFPKLPPEIRQNIWKHCIEGLRIIEVYRFWRRARGQGGELIPRLMVKQAPSPILHVCLESRQVALKKYSLQLSISRQELANTRIDPEADIICLPRLSWTQISYEEWFEGDMWSQEALQFGRFAINSRN